MGPLRGIEQHYSRRERARHALENGCWPLLTHDLHPQVSASVARLDITCGTRSGPSGAWLVRRRCMGLALIETAKPARTWAIRLFRGALGSFQCDHHRIRGTRAEFRAARAAETTGGSRR